MMKLDPDLLLPALATDLTPVALTEAQLPAPAATRPNLSDDEVGRIRQAVEASDADNTKRAYTSAWRSFVAFCEARGATALPAHPESIAAYLTLALRDNGAPYTVASLSLHLSAIKRAHREHNLSAPVDHPLVYRAWKGIRRQRGSQQQGATALTSDLLQQAVGTLPDNLRGVRDRMIMLVGFAGAFRRSELAALNLGDVVLLDQGIRLRAVRRKTSERETYIDLRRQAEAAFCPTAALEAWVEKLAADPGLRVGPTQPLLRQTAGPLAAPWVENARLSAASIRLVVMRAAEAAGLDPAVYSAHSLRSGFATSAAEAEVSAMEIRDAGGWRSLATVDRYVQHRRQFGADAPRNRVLAALAGGGSFAPELK